MSSVDCTKQDWDTDLCFPEASTPNAFILFLKALFLNASPVSSSDVDLDISDISGMEERSRTDLVNILIPAIGVRASGTPSSNSSYQGSASGQI